MIGRTPRRRAPSDRGGSIEFAELLDPIFAPMAPHAVDAVEVIEPVEVVEVAEEAQPVDEPIPAPAITQSRFADAGLDDNRLPVRPPKHRWLHR